jgi:DNA-directed RNA polymerase subunit L
MKIEIIEQNNVLGDSYLKFKINNVSHIILNSMRRIMYSSIKIRKFNNFNFKTNTSIYHNGYLELRISQLPIWISDDIIDNQRIIINNNNTINKNINNNDDEIEDDNIDSNDNIEINTLKQLSMYVKYINKTNNNINITTDNCLFYFGSNKIDSPYEDPLLLLILKPEQEIEFTAITDIGTENKHTSYSAISVASYEEINENEFIFNIESRGQISEKKILIISMKNIQRMLTYFISIILKKTELLELTEGKFNIINTNNEIDDLHTLGSLIESYLHNHDDVSYAAYNLPHPLSDTIIFDFKIKNNNIIKILDEIVNNIIKKYDLIKNEIEKKIK